MAVPGTLVRVRGVGPLRPCGPASGARLLRSFLAQARELRESEGADFLLLEAVAGALERLVEEPAWRAADRQKAAPSVSAGAAQGAGRGYGGPVESRDIGGAEPLGQGGASGSGVGQSAGTHTGDKVGAMRKKKRKKKKEDELDTKEGTSDPELGDGLGAGQAGLDAADGAVMRRPKAELPERAANSAGEGEGGAEPAGSRMRQKRTLDLQEPAVPLHNKVSETPPPLSGRKAKRREDIGNHPWTPELVGADPELENVDKQAADSVGSKAVGKQGAKSARRLQKVGVSQHREPSVAVGEKDRPLNGSSLGDPPSKDRSMASRDPRSSSQNDRGDQGGMLASPSLKAPKLTRRSPNGSLKNKFNVVKPKRATKAVPNE